jgi:hypothetical protein
MSSPPPTREKEKENSSCNSLMRFPEQDRPKKCLKMVKDIRVPLGGKLQVPKLV